MKLRRLLTALVCGAALGASATPVFQTEHLYLRKGIAYVERNLETIAAETFGNGLGQWTVDNYEKKLSITTEVFEGEQAVLLTLKQDKCDTAWELRGKPFPVKQGQGYRLKIRARGSINMSIPKGHKLNYATAIFWFDAAGQQLEDFQRYGFPSYADAWTDTAVEGTVPDKAVRAVVSLGADSPNFEPGDTLAISRIEFQMGDEKLPCFPQARFDSNPVLTDGTPQRLSWEGTGLSSKNVAFQIATAPDKDGLPGEWSAFAGPDGKATSYYTTNGTRLKQVGTWVRYRAFLSAKGNKTPGLQSVTLGKNIQDQWEEGDRKSPQFVMLSESPNQHPELPIRFQIQDDSPVDWTRVKYYMDGEIVNAKVRRQGNELSFQDDKPFQPRGVTMKPIFWGITNYQQLLSFVSQEERPGAVRVTLKEKTGDTAFHLISQPFPVYPKQEYSFGLTVRYPMDLTGKQPKQGRIIWLDDQGKAVGQEIPILLGAPCPDWTKLTFKGTSPENASAVKLDVGFDVPNIGPEDFFDLDVLEIAGNRPPQVVKPDEEHVHTIRVTGRDMYGNAFDETRFILFGKPVTKNIVTMRDDGFILIDGKPFFPRGLYGMSEKPFNHNSYDEAFRELRKNGFNFGHTYSDTVSPRREKFLNAAAANGIKVWIPPRGPMDECLMTERHHPAILAWYLGDDTADHIPANVVRTNHLMCHAIDNAHLTTQADVVGGRWSSRYKAYVHSTDTFLPEIYPMHDAAPLPTEVPSVIDDMQTIFADIREQGSPVKSVWAIIQHFDGWGWKRFPSLLEQRAMTYLAIIHGAHGLTWYTYGGNDKDKRGVASSPEKWTEICTIGRELEALDYALTARHAAQQPAFTILDGPQQDGGKHPSISRLLKNNDGKKIFFTANSATEPVKASFALKGFKKAKVLFENREVALDAKGNLVDDFGKFAVHVYELE